MPQDAVSGARANEYGHATARRIADKIGALSTSDRSNEFSYQGRRITIRCARKTTNDVGVTYNMLDRVDSIVAAFENDVGAYDLYEIAPALYREHLRDSKGEGHVGLVTRSKIKEIGQLIETVVL